MKSLSKKMNHRSSISRESVIEDEELPDLERTPPKSRAKRLMALFRQRSNSDSSESIYSDDFANDTYETKAVYYLKLLLLIILSTLAVGVAVTVFLLSRSSETEIFEEATKDDSTKILESVGGSTDLSLSAIDNFVVSIASYADDANRTWPFVSLPHHAVKMAKVRAISKALYMCIFPVVTLAEKQKWENYSLPAGNAWVRETLQTQKADINYRGIHIPEYDPSPVIYRVDAPADGDGPFMPSWQAYPVVPIWSPFNWDYATYTPFDKKAVVDDLKVSFSKIINMPDSDDPWVISEAKIASNWAKDFVGPNENADEPSFHIFYPIVKNAAKEILYNALPPAKHPQGAVGVATIIIYARDLIRNILPPDSDGMVVVFENTCNQMFSYRIIGPGVEYLGQGDHHDRHYDSLMSEARLADLRSTYMAQDYSYTGFPISEEGCQYSLRVYPSSEMEDRFASKNPAIYTSAFALVFALVVVIFLLFDRCVERKNRKVMFAALRRLEEANKNIKEASSKQLEHFASMSHEIRTPLNCIIGMSNLLLETGDLNDIVKENVQMITTSGDLLLTVVNDVLDIAKMATNKFDVQIECTNLHQIATTVVKSIQFSGKGKRVSVQCTYEGDVPEYLNTDGRRLQQVLYNLLSNAQKFSKEGGVVELTVSVVHDVSGHQHKRSEPKPNGILRFVVKDFGKGISQKDMECIFEPFNQGSASDVELYNGTGLGLAITSKLIPHLGGSIRVDSQVGSWTEFTVEIPYTLNVFMTTSIMHPVSLPPCTVIPQNLCLEGNNAADVSILPAPFDKLNVLNVDDNVVNRKLLRKMLSTFGVLNVEDAKDGQEAVDMTCKKLYDIIFMDISMPRLSGIEATRIIKARNNREKVFIVTAHALQSCEVDSKECGADGYIVKPYSKHDIGLLLQTVNIEDVRINREDVQEIPPPPIIVRALESTASPPPMARVVESTSSPVYSSEYSGQSSSPMECRKTFSAKTAVTGSKPVEISSYSPLRCLVVDDNDINCILLQRMLKTFGVSVISIAHDGLEAIECLSHQQLDLVFMDLQMPRMDGFEATRIIKQSYPSVKIFMVTAHATKHHEKISHECGVEAFVTKPLKRGSVEEMLNRCIDRHDERQITVGSHHDQRIGQQVNGGNSQVYYPTSYTS